MAENDTPYNVAFRYTAGAGAYAGIITGTAYPSKEYFDREVRPKLPEMNEEVVEEGITSDHIRELGDSAPLSARLKVALHESTIPGTDEVDEDVLQLNLMQAILARIL